jgi:hypothetical protein
MDNRKSRQAKLKQGPGTFKYLGGAFDTESTPTILKTSKKAPAIGDDGMPLYDRASRAVMVPAGAPVRDERGNPVLGGPPKIKKVELKTCVVRRKEFPLGKPVEVTDESLALKLRGLKTFEEVGAKQKGRKSEGSGDGDGDAPATTPAT